MNPNKAAVVAASAAHAEALHSVQAAHAAAADLPPPRSQNAHRKGCECIIL